MIKKEGIRWVYKRIKKIIYKLGWVSHFFIVVLGIVIVVDVTGRYFFKKPLLGSLELIELSMMLMGGFALTFTSIRKHHVSIDVLITRLPKRVQIWIESVSHFLGFAIWAVFTYTLFMQAIKSFQWAEVTDSWHFPKGYFYLTAAIALSIFSLTQLLLAFEPLIEDSVETEHKVAGDLV